MPYITRLDIRRCRNIEELSIELPPGDRPFRHLILTGPNGSGKSGVLEGLKTEWDLLGPALFAFHPRDRLNGTSFLSLLGAIDVRNVAHDTWSKFPVLSTWTSSLADIVQTLEHGDALLTHFSARRTLDLQSVEGPRTLPNIGTARLQPTREWFLQYLVNKKFDELLSRTEDQDTGAADRLAAWFERLETQLRTLFEAPGLRLVFDRKRYAFSLQQPNGYTFDFNTLADGHHAVLVLYFELLLRQSLMAEERGDPSFQPEGVVIIDEVEAHLHLSLQERILPFLTGMFPKLQFIVATHSPAVIASIDGAIVYDLGSRSAVPSEDMRGVRYGTLIREHFGLRHDMDLESARKLERLTALAKQDARSPEEEAELRALAGFLSERSHTLALEVWDRLGRGAA